MNNKILMRALAVAKDPAFIEQIAEGKEQIGLMDGFELSLGTDMAVLANTCIALDQDRPDFAPLVNVLEMQLKGSLDEVTNHRRLHILGLIDMAWNLISQYFPLNEYGFPTVDLWGWTMRCLTGDEIPEIEESRYPASYSFDPEQLMLTAKLAFLEELLKEKGIDPAQELVARGYEKRLDRIAEILAVEPRYFIEVLPGTSFEVGVTRVKGWIDQLIMATLSEHKRYKVPQGYREKLKRYFEPRQFQAKKLDEMARDLGEDRSTSNISREYNELAKKAGYDPVPPQPRGKGRV